MRRDYERLRIGHELAKAVGAELDLDKLLPKILDKAFELVGADRGVLLLMDTSGDLVPSYVKTREGKGEEDNIVLSKTVTAEVIQRKAAVLSSDATLDDRFSGAHSIIMQGIRSTMTVPLLHSDEILGLMHLDSQIASNAFTEKDLQICIGMASQAAVAIQNARLAQRIEKEAQTRAQISRLIPPSVVDQVLAGELTIEKGGRLNEITMLYSDIRGFTAMSDGAPPEEVVNTLNEYFEVMVEVLFRHQGTLDKFVGDEIIGLFGAPIAHEEHAVRACYAALAMQEAIRRYSEEVRRARGLEVQIRVGLNSGLNHEEEAAREKRLRDAGCGRVGPVSRMVEALGADGRLVPRGRTLLGRRAVLEDDARGPAHLDHAQGALVGGPEDRVVDEVEVARSLGPELDDGRATRRNHGGLHVVRDRGAALLVDVVEDLADHVEAAGQVRAAVADEQADGLADLGLVFEDIDAVGAFITRPLAQCVADRRAQHAVHVAGPHGPAAEPGQCRLAEQFVAGL